MPVIGPIVAETLRRQWPMLGALGVLVAVTLAHLLIFGPMAQRYDLALKSAGDLGLALDPDQMPESIPPRLFALIADNAIASAAAQERASSGALTATLIEDINRFASRHDMDLVLTEPGVVTQQQGSVVVHAHFKVRCRYRDLVALLDDIAKSGSLISVDRFTLEPLGAGTRMLEIWLSRCVLKQTGGSR